MLFWSTELEAKPVPVSSFPLPAYTLSRRVGGPEISERSKDGYGEPKSRLVRSPRRGC